MKKIFYPICTFLLCLSGTASAQALSGTYNIPSLSPPLPTLRSVIDSLNRRGISGPVTINLSQNENAPSGGYILGSDTLNPTLSATNSIVINGNDVVITAPTGTGAWDGIFNIVGADYIKVNQLNLVEKASNTTATTMMERGFSILKTNSDNGCKTISIINSNVTLNNSNNTAANNIAPYGATGIFVGNCTYASSANLAEGFNDSCTHEGIFLFQDTIKNVNSGIYVYGNALTADGSKHNDKTATIQENNIENFTHLGVSLSYFNGDLVQANTINNTASGGTAPTANMLYGVRYYNPSTTLQTNTNWTSTKNKIELTINSSGSSYAATGVFSQVYGTGTTSISNDSIKIVSAGASAQINGIYSQNNLGTQTISSNYLYDFATATTNQQAVIGIFSGGYSPFPSLGLSDQNIYPTSSTVSGNTLTNFKVSSGTTSSSSLPLIVGLLMDDNLTDNPLSVTKNHISDIEINATSNSCIGFGQGFTSSRSNSATITFSDNLFENFSTSGTANATPIRALLLRGPYSTGMVLNSTKNYMKNFSTQTGLLLGYDLGNGKTVNMSRDTITNFNSSAWTAVGIINANNNYGVRTINADNCLISGIKTTSLAAGASAAGAYLLAGTSTQTTAVNLNKNIFEKINSSDATGNAIGLNIATGTATNSIYNNMISDIAAPSNTSAYSSSYGINLGNTGTNNVYFNTIKLNTAATAATGYGATALMYSPGATNTIQNNILHANITAGTGNNVAAIRASSGTPSAAPSVSGFTASSNIYFSPKGANNYLYVEGTLNTGLANGYHVSGLTENSTKNIVNDTFFNSECGKSSYHKFMQTATASREKKTFTENNLSGSAGVFSPSGLSYAESSATDGPISTDFLAAARPFGSSDIGALEFAGTIRPQMDITITSSSGFDTACTGNLPSLTATVPTFFNRVSYQWYRDTTRLTGSTAKSVAVGPLSGKYIVTVYDSVTGCSYDSEPYKMTVVPPPPALISYYDSLTFCETSAIVIQANKGYNYSYRWYKNTSLISGETDDHLVVSTSGDYSLEVNTPLGCPTTSTPIRVKVYPLPTPSISWAGPRQLTTQKYYLYQWYKNNIKIDSFAQSRTYYCFDDGAYTVEVTDSNGCTAKSDVFLFALGINDPAIAAGISIFPNPATDKINIVSPIAVMAKLTDITGRIVIAPAQVRSLDISSLAEGIYLLSVTDLDGNLIRVEKINKIKQ